MERLLRILIGVLLLSVGAQLSIQLPEDISILPVTGQTLIIAIIAEMYDWKSALAVILLYIILALLGLPVLTEFKGGIETVMGPSLGYLIAFMIVTPVMSYFATQRSSATPKVFLRLLLLSFVILLLGSLGLLRYYDLGEALKYGALPFLPGALLKTFLATLLIYFFRRFMSLMNHEDFRGSKSE